MATLYHYTTPAGFEGILTSKGVWATDTRYLNDRDEFKIGWDVFRDVFRSHEMRLRSEYPEAHEWLLGVMQGIDGTTAHVASFSLKGDMLSQWRGYNGGYGFSLGFDAEALNSASQAQHFEMGPVVYHRPKHFDVMSDVFNVLFGMLDDGSRSFGHLMVMWWNHALKAVTIIKNEHFIEEDEYRIYAGSAADKDAVKVRSSARALIPYLQIQLDQVMTHFRAHENLGLKEVIVGPAMSFHQVFAAELLLKQHGIEVPVRPSSIPYIGT